MTTKITPAALRSAAAKQRVCKPLRDGYSVCERTRHWDAVIVRRQLQAQEWRTYLAGSMEMDGVTELRASTIRLMAFPSYRCRLTTVTVYACTDGSPYLYRIGSRFYAPMQFNNQYGDYYTLTRAGDIGPIFGTLPRLLPA